MYLHAIVVLVDCTYAHLTLSPLFQLLNFRAVAKCTAFHSILNTVEYPVLTPVLTALEAWVSWRQHHLCVSKTKARCLIKASLWCISGIFWQGDFLSCLVWSKCDNARLKQMAKTIAMKWIVFKRRYQILVPTCCSGLVAAAECEVEDSIPSCGGRILVRAKCKNARVLRFRYTFK